ncbi:hypothetical protein [Pontibacter sp. G13]|uniref:hypothetical protein n=1 Tax=Pontibacter sp. G13 TaxID=3074898 RepID=UPI00288B3C94|nr:hypothetical protein [Pontibacter sp. G13]WNJ16037.1 hypothetical protein RJD25_14335 [Pontibacter sp. G13]
MRKTFAFALFLFSLALTAPVAGFAQSSSTSLTRAARLYVNSTQDIGDYYQINYEVNAPGFVELHLIGPNGKKLWIKGQVTERAYTTSTSDGRQENIKDKFLIPKKPLKVGERYDFFLMFKGTEYKSSFYAD